MATNAKPGLTRRESLVTPVQGEGGSCNGIPFLLSVRVSHSTEPMEGDAPNMTPTYVALLTNQRGFGRCSQTSSASLQQEARPARRIDLMNASSRGLAFNKRRSIGQPSIRRCWGSQRGVPMHLMEARPLTLLQQPDKALRRLGYDGVVGYDVPAAFGITHCRLAVDVTDSPLGSACAIFQYRKTRLTQFPIPHSQASWVDIAALL